jgi:GntR family transcriptional regulator
LAVSPRYQQIAADLRRRIASGEFGVNTPLPTEMALQEQYQTSRNTVRAALGLLAQQHLVETRPGRGTFVIEEVDPYVITLSAEVADQAREAVAGTPSVQVVNCPSGIAALLRIDQGDLVVSRYQQRFIKGAIWSSQTSYYPLDLVQRGAGGLLDPKDTPAGIADAIGFKQVGYRDLVAARPANDREQELFGLTHNHTVIEVHRTSFAEDGSPVLVTVSAFPSDRNQLVYEIGTVPQSAEESDGALAMLP